MKGNTTKKTATATRQTIKVGAAKTLATKSSATKTKRATSSSTKTKATTATKAKANATTKAKPAAKTVTKSTTRTKSEPAKSQAKDIEVQPKRAPLARSRAKALRTILLAKREAIMKQMREQLGQSLTDDQQRRLESAMDSGDQALFDLEREMGISLQEMRNRERQLIEESLSSLEEGTYGLCGECDEEISEKRLEALPFARYCIACQSRMELLEKIEKGEQRT